jgi:Methyltransferase domain
MRSDWVIRICPNCKSGKISDIPDAESARPAESMSFAEVKENFVGLRNDQVFFSYFRCKGCNLLYAPKYFSESQLEELYRDMPDNLMGEDKSTVSKTQSGYVDWLSMRVNSSSHYLEIGPDIGLVAGEIKNRFKTQVLAMVEPNKSVHNELKANINHERLKVYEYISELEPSDIFDLVAGIHVFDHLLSPVHYLHEIRAHATDNANLLVVVHDEDSLLRKAMKSKWPPFCLQHPQLYNPSTLREILQRAGWKIEHLSKSTNWWNLDYFAETGSKVVGLPTKWSKILPSVELPIRLGNLIALARRI